MGRVEDQLADLGVEVPDGLPAGGVYAPVLIDGGLAYTSGLVAVEDRKLAYQGRLGDDLTETEGKASARLACLATLGNLRASVGTLDRVERVVKLTGYVRSAPEFTGLPQVMDGASELLVDAFGEAGKGARTSVGVAALPAGASVELDLIVRLRA